MRDFVGRSRAGEGVARLRQAFRLAAARAVVSSLWIAPEPQESQLLRDFFAGLAAGQSKADALRSAQLKMIAAFRRQGSANPFYWASLTLTGQ